MEIYQVGGAVRDSLLARKISDCDWVVVGETVESMLQKGFKPVGKDFPVFLHPKTKEEYALARTERKVSKGYHGFDFFTSPDVTLIEDLARRDLTINAIARSSETGELVDPYGGKQDCENKILRHVSSAFVEDPVRVLRLARFSATFPEFTIAEETAILVESMVHSGEMAALVKERIWQETEKALATEDPMRFFEVLSALNVLEVVMPALMPLGQKDWQLLRHFSTQLELPQQRLAFLGLYLDLGTLKLFTQILALPKEYETLLQWIIKHLDKISSLKKMTPEGVLELLSRLDVWRREDRFFIWLDCALVIRDLCSEQLMWKHMVDKCRHIPVAQWIQKGLQGRELASAIKQSRLEVINHYLATLPD